ncbi:hypothetical protein A2U01_0083844, partial [Trifolium medium]|nr:hypothetical protein [Trifolium medium]
MCRGSATLPGLSFAKEHVGRYGRLASVRARGFGFVVVVP